MVAPAHDISRLSRGERIWFAATGLAFGYAKALGTDRSLASQGALTALRSFFNANREELVIAMTAGGFPSSESALPVSAPMSGAFTADDSAIVAVLASGYFNHNFSGSNFTSPAAIGRWWWSDLETRLTDEDYIVQVFLSAVAGGPEVDAGSRLSREAANIVSGVVNVGVGSDIADGSRASQQTARAVTAAIAEATGSEPGDAEAIELPETRIVGTRTARDAIPPWAVAVGAVAFVTLGGGLVYVAGRKKRWWQ